MLRLNSHYFGSIAYWSALALDNEVIIDELGRFEKQTFRNRTVIIGPNGKQDLIVPVFGRNHRLPMKEVKISYEEPWVRVHLNSLQTAYRSAPYFEYVYPEIEVIILKKYKHLLELNSALFEWIAKRLGIAVKINQYSEQIALDSIIDLRSELSSKNGEWPIAVYPQVFQEKLGFIPTAGIIDLLMNDLSCAGQYLSEQALPYKLPY